MRIEAPMSLLLMLCTLALSYNYAEGIDDFTLGVLYAGSSSALEAAAQAEHDINNSSLLPAGYRIQIIAEESKACDGKPALRALYAHLFNESLYAVISGICPHDTNILAAITDYNHLTLVSSVPSSGLDEDELYPYHFHIVPSLSNVALGIANFISYHEFGWHKLVIITQDQDDFKMTSRMLLETLVDRNYTVKGDIVLSEGLVSVTRDNIFVPDFRVYVLNVNSTWAKMIFCEAINAGLKEYRYVWIIPGTYSDHWLKGNVTQSGLVYECQHSPTEIEEFVYQQRVIAINHYPHAVHHDTVTLTNRNTHSLEEQFRGDDVAILAYDSVLTVASSLPFDDLNTTDSVNAVKEAIKDNIQNVTLLGASGEIQFVCGSRQALSSRIFQYRNRPDNMKAPTLVGVVSLEAEDYMSSLTFFDENQSDTMKLWPEGVPPDGEPITVVNYPLMPIVILSYIYSGIVIICTVLCLASTFALRAKKLIRLTSPNLNFIIGLGVIIFCSSVFLFVYPPLSTNVLVYYCASRSWFAAIGYSLCFGTMNTKMWRVYYIFHDIKPTSNKKAIKDWHLFFVVSIFVIVDVIILVIVTSLPSTRLEPETLPDKEFGNATNSDGITVKHEVIICEAQYKTLWLVILFGYKVVIQVIGVFLAFKIRKVKIKVLNDSKEVAITLYITSIILAAVIIITVAFDDYLNVYSATYSLGIPLASSVVLGVVYFSKMFKLYRDPNGDTIFTHVTNDATGAAGGTALATCDDHERIIYLENRVKDLQAKLTTKESNDVLKSSNTFVDSSSTQPPSLLPGAQRKQVRIECPD